MLNNRDVTDFIADTLYLSHDRLFVVKDNLELEQIENEALLDSMQTNLAKYQAISEYVVHNDFLKKNNLQENLCLINADFDNTSLKYFEDEIVNVDGNKCLRIDNNREYAGICPAIDFEKEIKRIKVEIRFDLQSLDTTAILPKLAIEKDGTEPYYYCIKIDSTLNTGSTETFSFKSTINFSEPTNGDRLKIYLWNSKRATMLYDNLFVNIAKLSD